MFKHNLRLFGAIIVILVVLIGFFILSQGTVVALKP
jgi:hypothetical protein